MDKRIPFIDTLLEIAENDERIVLIICDVGFKHADRFKERFPKRYFNLGVTEQSSMIVAAAMALSGLKPYFYSMTNFSVFRPFEMVRNAVALHGANVKIIGVGGRDSYKMLGFSHNLVFEDEDIHHLQPYMDCHTPSYDEVEGLTRKTYEEEKPCFIRL